ncbi:integrase family protein [Bradyrhizobium sp. JYMT SZCCT0428]|uniref:tyrosine-type recombinase/integrase n=1 Tax=Bradyrhizobium sp. JYMT SZCCT0428 TaxID=2807673 RepID=UPI001BA8B399|nr:integrase family protein [Bradyrhizobium sp. JYMT SZCCT0428]MBR1155637.1 integrase family protein [Bradyrhizobium sp. JYMT SZCCT0428]
MQKRIAPNKQKLTEFLVKNLQPQERAYLVWDTLQRGLAVRVEPTGHRAWKAIYKFGGRPRWYNIGSTAAVGLADARRLAGRVMYAVAEGADPQAERRVARSSGTFEDLAKRYAAYAESRNKSWRQADALVRRHLMPKWAKIRAADITRSDVRTLMARIHAPIVANQVLASASAIFTWAIREEFAEIKINPCHAIERNPTQSRDRVVSDSEVPRIWAEFEVAGLQGKALQMLLLTGQRPGEVSHMRTEHIADGWWTMPGAVVAELNWPGTKNAQSHRVWLPIPAQAILAEMDAAGLVFAGPRGGAVKELDAAMRQICAKLGVPAATPHDLRRTHGTLIASLGFGRDAMNRIQNHAEGGIASVYDRHQYADENKRIMEAVASRVMSLIQGTAGGNVLQFGKNPQGPVYVS